VLKKKSSKKTAELSSDSEKEKGKKSKKKSQELTLSESEDEKPSKKSSSKKGTKRKQKTNQGTEVLSKEELKEEAEKELLKRYQIAKRFTHKYEQMRKAKKSKTSPQWEVASTLMDKAAKLRANYVSRGVIKDLPDQTQKMVEGLKKRGETQFKQAQKILETLDDDDRKKYDALQERNKNAKSWDELVSKAEHETTQQMEIFKQSFMLTMGEELPEEAFQKLVQTQKILTKKIKGKLAVNPVAPELVQNNSKLEDEIDDPLRVTDRLSTDEVPLSPENKQDDAPEERTQEVEEN
jgi:hypothetical protein